MANMFNGHDHTKAGEIVGDSINAIANYVVIKYNDLPFWDDLEEMTDAERAEIAYVAVGDAFGRICDALYKDYEPLENFYTNGESEENKDGTKTRSGSVESTPTGTINVKQNGTKVSELDNSISVGQGTTYDNATTDPSLNTSSTSDFVNVSRNLNKGKSTETFANYGTETTYNNYKVTQEFKNLTDTDDFTTTKEEHRSGSSGIFSKQDLTQREINLRIKNLAISILVRMCVDVFNTGVWQE